MRGACRWLPGELLIPGEVSKATPPGSSDDGEWLPPLKKHNVDADESAEVLRLSEAQVAPSGPPSYLPAGRPPPYLLTIPPGASPYL